MFAIERMRKTSDTLLRLLKFADVTVLRGGERNEICQVHQVLILPYLRLPRLRPAGRCSPRHRPSLSIPSLVEILLSRTSSKHFPTMPYPQTADQAPLINLVRSIQSPWFAASNMPWNVCQISRETWNQKKTSFQRRFDVLKRSTTKMYRYLGRSSIRR